MPRHAEQRRLPYSPEQMFDLVADVGRYPEFLPWCVGARIISRRDDEMLADLIIGFRLFRERFRSRVKFERPDHIHVEYIEGPLKYLHNDWRFSSDGEGGCVVDFYVDFAFKNRLFESMVGRLFTEAVHRMVGAFERRADALYGAQTSASN